MFLFWFVVIGTSVRLFKPSLSIMLKWMGLPMVRVCYMSNHKHDLNAHKNSMKNFKTWIGHCSWGYLLEGDKTTSEAWCNEMNLPISNGKIKFYHQGLHIGSFSSLFTLKSKGSFSLYGSEPIVGEEEFTCTHWLGRRKTTCPSGNRDGITWNIDFKN